MDNQAQDSQKQAHDNAVAAGKLLADAQLKSESASKMLDQANVIMAQARQFQAKLNERQKKLDQAFVALNKQKDQLRKDQFASDERDLLVRDNMLKY